MVVFLAKVDIAFGSSDCHGNAVYLWLDVKMSMRLNAAFEVPQH